jgi:hypothetical protein
MSLTVRATARRLQRGRAGLILIEDMSALPLALSLALAFQAKAQEVSLRQDFDSYLESQGATASDWQAMPPDQKSRLLQGYIAALDGSGKKDEGAVELLRKLRDPDAMKRYTDGSGRLRPFLDAKPSVDAGPPGSDSDENRAADQEVALAAGLSMLEKLRPAPGGPPGAVAPPKSHGPPAIVAGPDRAALEDLGARRFGRELLDEVAEDWTTLDIRTRDGAVLTVEYEDLPKDVERGKADVYPKAGRYRVTIDRSLQGTEAELAIKAHELSHVRDAEELPDARPEDMGLLMEHRAYIYEVSTWIERHPDIRDEPPPSKFYDAEEWFKARVFAGGLDASFPDSIPDRGPWAQMRAKARSIVAACAKDAPCGGMRALENYVIDPSYADSDEGSILELELANLDPSEQVIYDRALVYQAETNDLERRLRSAYGLQP